MLPMHVGQHSPGGRRKFDSEDHRQSAAENSEMTLLLIHVRLRWASLRYEVAVLLNCYISSSELLSLICHIQRIARHCRSHSSILSSNLQSQSRVVQSTPPSIKASRHPPKDGITGIE
jgi:hypothetical protein